MTIYWNIVIWDKESAEIIKRPLIFIQVEAAVIPAKFHDLSVMLTNLKDSHDLPIVFWKIPITHELVEQSRFSFFTGLIIPKPRDQYLETDWFVKWIRFLLPFLRR